jgi:hypothetical protein
VLYRIARPTASTRRRQSRARVWTVAASVALASGVMAGTAYADGATGADTTDPGTRKTSDFPCYPLTDLSDYCMDRPGYPGFPEPGRPPGGISGVETRTSAPVTVTSAGATATVNCPAGKVATGGGFRVNNAVVVTSEPITGTNPPAGRPTGWRVGATFPFDLGQPGESSVTAVVVCANRVP